MNLIKEIFSVRNQYSSDKVHKIITVCGLKFKFCNYKKSYYLSKSINAKIKYQFNYLKEHSDITKLKPATGLIRKRQLDLLNFAINFMNEISEINIKPFLIGGNLIGVLRNNSFVPWDDDLDFGLLREDYEKLKAYAKKNYICIIYEFAANDEYDSQKVNLLLDKYLRKNPGQYIMLFKYDMLQLMKGTSLKDYVMIDFFSHDFYSENYSFSDHEKYMQNIYETIKKKKLYKDIVKYIDKERINNKNIVEFSNKIYYGMDNGDTRTIMGKNADFMPIDTILPLKKSKFEGLDFYIPNNAYKYLNFYYSDIESYPDDFGFPQHTRFIN